MIPLGIELLQPFGILEPVLDGVAGHQASGALGQHTDDLGLATALIFPGIAWMSHLGGFIAGAAATAVLVGELKRRRTSQCSLSVSGLIAIVVVIVGALVVKYAITA